MDPEAGGSAKLLKGENPLYVNGRECMSLIFNIYIFSKTECFSEINPTALLEFYKDIQSHAELTDEEAASLVAYKVIN